MKRRWEGPEERSAVRRVDRRVPPAEPHQPLLQLQRLAGNRATLGLIDAVQRKTMADHYDGKAAIHGSSPERSPHSPGITDDAAEGVGAMFERAETEIREREQLSDPGWQAKLGELARPGPTEQRPLRSRRLRKAAGRMTPKFFEGVRDEMQANDPAWTKRLGELSRRDPGGEVVEGSVGAKAEAHEERAKVQAEQARAAREAKAKADAEDEAQAKVEYEASKKLVDERFTKAKATGLLADSAGSTRSTMHKEEKAGRFVQAAIMAKQLADECSEAIAFFDQKNAIDDRLAKLTGTDLGKEPRQRIVDLKGKLSTALNKTPRNRAQITAALQSIEDILQPVEDRKADAEATAAARADLRAKGLWPGNGRAAAQIQERNRGNVGSTREERRAVVQALDAINDPTRPHTWARVWGDYHGNGEGNLPGIRGGGGYKEYYVSPLYQANYAGTTLPGARRVVVSEAHPTWVYYSDNHYGHNGTVLPAFVKITDP